jgi:hypothetical protein
MPETATDVITAEVRHYRDLRRIETAAARQVERATHSLCGALEMLHRAGQVAHRAGVDAGIEQGGATGLRGETLVGFLLPALGGGEVAGALRSHCRVVPMLRVGTLVETLIRRLPPNALPPQAP